MIKDESRCRIFLNAPLSSGVCSIDILGKDGESLTIPASEDDETKLMIVEFEKKCSIQNTAFTECTYDEYESQRKQSL